MSWFPLQVSLLLIPGLCVCPLALSPSPQCSNAQHCLHISLRRPCAPLFLLKRIKTSPRWHQELSNSPVEQRLSVDARSTPTLLELLKQMFCPAFTTGTPCRWQWPLFTNILEKKNSYFSPSNFSSGSLDRQETGRIHSQTSIFLSLNDLLEVEVERGVPPFLVPGLRRARVSSKGLQLSCLWCQIVGKIKILNQKCWVMSNWTDAVGAAQTVCECKETGKVKVSSHERRQNKEYQTSWTDLQLTLAQHEERSLDGQPLMYCIEDS